MSFCKRDGIVLFLRCCNMTCFIIAHAELCRRRFSCHRGFSHINILTTEFIKHTLAARKLNSWIYTVTEIWKHAKMFEKQKKLIANRKKTTTTIVQVVYVEWKLFQTHTPGSWACIKIYVNKYEALRRYWWKGVVTILWGARDSRLYFIGTTGMQLDIVLCTQRGQWSGVEVCTGHIGMMEVLYPWTFVSSIGRTFVPWNFCSEEQQ